MDKKDVALQQIRYYKDIVATGYNLVTCGNCGITLIHTLHDTKINCLCEAELDFCDCPDLWYDSDLDNF